MPCLRDYIEQDPFGEIVGRGVEIVPPKIVAQVARQDMRELDFPLYRNDPSYFWARLGARRRVR